MVSLVGISSSETAVVKGGEEGMEFDILKRPPSVKCQTTTSSSSSSPGKQQEEEGEINVRAAGEENEEKKEMNSKEMDDDDNDGLKTPTSTDSKIPAEPKQCPPAPRKPKPNKRKASSPTNGSTAVRINPLLLDLSEELESLSHKVKKKTRTQEQQ
ncbi:hypothetical protein ERO13_D09G151850v2 [Gossypium hirsutum]|uniref:Cyclin-dependent protein kinase inhibitor SMR3 n=5 Tax=Gossypium TaxID=3633 RepID=A0A1U8I4N8_GOSHI|nr:cyclin-dependent protein kinase inhibitor SMR3 [Gossypium hirsutum]KAB2013655.1 hypothetical protein ES319_D09G170200v1 [Gossypium barbadense]TYG54404.1 hypothetical protein ES288_D09G186700v1 [Gossypium darwinii]TYH54633.1 hypothetical protein ES332_D09G182800v1 [Gossypium tomentosum]TYI65722.1 hypothetical protein E1A91_D09G176300v1 [Gossypium mustelinum]KAG4130561.1 hypothetical protein ERO13_D09G151850v2 [Gossypium hirsutum]